MSSTDKKVEWCLKKAQRELAEKGTHRGLVPTKPDREEAKKHLLKAEHNLKLVALLERQDFTDWAVSAVFYTIYHCFLAIITQFGYASRNQECTLALIQKLKDDGSIRLSDDILKAFPTLDPDKRQASSVISMREEYQYGTATSIDGTRLADLKDLCKKAIEETKGIIYAEK